MVPAAAGDRSAGAPMRIAFVTETWYPSVDGVVTRLANTVRELRRAGHEVLIIAPRGGPPSFHGATVRGLPTVRIGFVYGGRPWGLPLPRVRRYLAEFGPDVVHVVNPVLAGIAGVRAARRLRVPLVASYHTDVPGYARFYHLGWLVPLIWWAIAWMHRQAAVNLSTAPATRDELYRHRVPNVHIWRRGVDAQRFRPHRGRNRVPVDRRALSVLYVGRLAKEKGLHRLDPLVFPADGHRRPRTEIVLVGDGPDRERLVARFAGLPVTFTGVLTGEALTAAYGAADVLVFPSITDTVGLVMLEALACGLPVVAADTPASREVLGGCAAARLFPAEKPQQLPELIDELLESMPAAQLADIARTHAESWDWSAATEQLLGFYRQAMGTTGTPDTARSLIRHAPTSGM